jgi:carbon-monoxide dehydrogenase small subunit
MSAGSRKITFTLNAREVTVQCQPSKRLLDILRQDLHLTMTREGCGSGQCGACLVILDGNLINACLVPAFMLPNTGVVTLEGLVADKKFSALAESLTHAFHCGYCSSGMLLALASVLQQNESPSDEDLRLAVSGNICHCGSTLSALAAAKQFLLKSGRKHHGRKNR